MYMTDMSDVLALEMAIITSRTCLDSLIHLASHLELVEALINQSHYESSCRSSSLV